MPGMLNEAPRFEKSVCAEERTTVCGQPSGELADVLGEDQRPHLGDQPGDHGERRHQGEARQRAAAG